MSERFPVTWDDPAEAELSWEWEEMHCPHPLPPLAGEYMLTAVQDGFNYRFAKFDIPLRFRGRLVNGYLYIAPITTEGATLQDASMKSRAIRQQQMRTVRVYWDETVFPAVTEAYRWMREARVEAATLDESVAMWDELWHRLRRLWGLHFMITSASYAALDWLIDVYGRVVEGARPEDALQLVQGTANELQQVERDLFALVETAGAHPSVVDHILNDPHTSLSRLRGTTGGREVVEALERFLEQHGHLGQAYDDLSLPSWSEQPDMILTEIRKRLLHPEADPEARRKSLADEAEVLARQVRARLRERPDAWREFDDALSLAREAAPLTEGHNYWIDRMGHTHIRQFVVRIGRRLARAGVIAKPEDVFYLYVAEVGDALRSPRDLRQQVAERKADIEGWKQVRPPKYVGRPPEASAVPNRFDAPAPDQIDASFLRGVGASPGKVRGRARVVTSPDDIERVKPGEILVTAAANPSWVPLFGIISGLVTNTGGVLSHAAVVAREFRVPAVVGTGEATLRIHDGQQVELDGTSGEVRLL